jgi:hypothetical protein
MQFICSVSSLKVRRLMLVTLRTDRFSGWKEHLNVRRAIFLEASDLEQLLGISSEEDGFEIVGILSSEALEEAVIILVGNSTYDFYEHWMPKYKAEFFANILAMHTDKARHGAITPSSTRRLEE